MVSSDSCYNCIAAVICGANIAVDDDKCIAYHKAFEENMFQLPGIVEAIAHVRKYKVKPDEDYIVAIVSELYNFISRQKKHS